MENCNIIVLTKSYYIIILYYFLFYMEINYIYLLETDVTGPQVLASTKKKL